MAEGGRARFLLRAAAAVAILLAAAIGTAIVIRKSGEGWGTIGKVGGPVVGGGGGNFQPFFEIQHSLLSFLWGINECDL